MDATATPDQPQDVPTLRDLIQSHADRTGESRRALGDRSKIAHQTLGTWHAGTIKTFPDPETIQAFADATHYTVQTVLLAAAKTVGLQVTQAGTQLSNSLPPGTDALSPEDIDAIRAVVRQLVAARNERARVPLSPDFSRVEGLRLDEDAPSQVVHNNHDT
jgi:hypothetical protein